MRVVHISTAFSELKKRSRHVSTEGFELSRAKRYRSGLDATATTAEETAAAEAAKDVPKYTQRHVEFFEQAKLAEIARIRYVYGLYCAAGLQAMPLCNSDRRVMVSSSRRHCLVVL